MDGASDGAILIIFTEIFHLFREWESVKMDVRLSPMRPVLAESLPFTPFVNHRVQQVLKDFHCLHVGEEDSFCITKV